MKKYLSLLLVGIFATITLSLVSCSKDDDNDINSSSSSFTVNGTSYGTHNTTGASNTLTNLSARDIASISAELYPSSSDEFDFYPRVNISIDTKSIDIANAKGTTLTITGGYVEYITAAMSGTRYNEVSGGTISVKDVSSSKITLDFNNLKMKSSGGDTLTLNGTLVFEITEL